MRISRNWLSEIVDLSQVGPVEQLGGLLTHRGIEVERIQDLDKGLDHVVSAQIVERAPHPNSDRLSLCRVAIPEGVLEIVCGAQNMKAGDKVALAKVGAHLPNGLKISTSKIRGAASHGMLCSEEELHLSEGSSQGILILPPETPIGLPLAQVLGRQDSLLHLKVTPNRGDCLSHLGVAREIAAATGSSVQKPEVAQITGTSPFQIELGAGQKAPQFFGCSIDGVQIGPSPDWMVKRLEAIGQRSINNVVDATNWVLHELGQPLHAYDADKIKGRKIQVRFSQSGETLLLLDGKEIALTGEELVIADGSGPIALAGIMGGGSSEVQATTKNLFLEAAEFDPVSVRRSAVRFGRRTEAAQRFEKGIDPQGVEYALRRLVFLIQKTAGGKIVGGASSRVQETMAIKIDFQASYARQILGFQSAEQLPNREIQRVLEGLGCQLQTKAEDCWNVTPPSFRRDLSIKEDLVEELGRSIGYERIPVTLPVLTTHPVSSDSARPYLEELNQARKSLCQSGLCEVVNYSFTSSARLARFGMKSNVKILNPLSAEHEVLVPSLIPGIVSNAVDNMNNHFGSEPLSIRLFELRPVFHAASPIQASHEEARGVLSQTGVEETMKLAFLISGPRFAQALKMERGEIDFFDVKAVVDNLLADLGTKGVRIQKAQSELLHPGQGAEIWIGSQKAGFFGMLHPGMSRKLKLKSSVGIAEFDWKALQSLSRKFGEYPKFKAWPQFPPMERDFALIVRDEITAEKVCQMALKAGKPLAKSAKIFDIYRGAQVTEGMTSVAVRVIFYEEDRSLLESEVEAASAKIVEGWKKDLGIELRG